MASAPSRAVARVLRKVHGRCGGCDNCRPAEADRAAAAQAAVSADEAADAGAGVPPVDAQFPDGQRRCFLPECVRALRCRGGVVTRSGVQS